MTKLLENGFAILFGNAAAVEALLAAGANPAAARTDGATPASLAERSDNREVAKLFAQPESDPGPR